MKITYRGPGDAVELDGIEIRKGEAIEVTHEQYQRIQNSDPEAKVDVSNEKTADPERVRESQAKARERELKKAEKSAEKEAS